ncbi:MULTISPECIES: GNAT family N-acetyltransferase [Priestia]|jgi:ribosomal protein S18 acetylase RimI-like enzyme|uniref:GNAT family N-acetyltransferase n=1 Tax=Priestia TaxID=2800373 RepID=UPI0005C481D4|nr:GNAT family N-acetyltransferase [Priestia megaterium]MCF8886619.1 GNAT family N-acetyltransferase [Priestia megaterium]NEW02921.1 GNAT family N-acetyltransferase [Priestia megaterium]NGY84659.1 GNAT family N-acetyltransferase [Priestia megaterium]
MKYCLAQLEDAATVHDLMLQAFSVYRDSVPPSSALDETIESIMQSLKHGKKAVILYVENKPVAMARFTLEETSLYFYRLSVIPAFQGKGMAKQLIQWLETYAKECGKESLLCKVRMSVFRNIALYESIGFYIEQKEIVHRDGVDIPVVNMKKEILKGVMA